MNIQPVGKGKTQIGSKIAQVDEEFRRTERNVSDWARKMTNEANERPMTVGELVDFLGSVPREYEIVIADTNANRNVRECYPDHQHKRYIIS